MPKCYVDIQKHWRKIKPHAESKTATQIWKRDLEKYHTAFVVYGPELDFKDFNEDWFDEVNRPFNPTFPADVDSCDWRCDRKGKEPAFWKHVVHGKCHWMVNFNLYCAQKSFPKSQWRIITAEEHSCVWDGEDNLFDMNFLALLPDITEHPFYDGLPGNAEVLPIGEELEIGIQDMDVRVLEKFNQGVIDFDFFYDHFFSRCYVDKSCNLEELIKSTLNSSKNT